MFSSRNKALPSSFAELLDALRGVLREQDALEARELLRHDEFGVALELIAEQLHEFEVRVPPRALKLIAELAGQMGLASLSADGTLLQKLRQRAKDDSADPTIQRELDRLLFKSGLDGSRALFPLQRVSPDAAGDFGEFPERLASSTQAREVVDVPLNEHSRELLVKAGWFPGRNVDRWLDEMIREVYDPEGYLLFERARVALLAYGGLKINDRGPGRCVFREPFGFDPLFAPGEREEVDDFAAVVGEPLCPIGYAEHGVGLLVMSPSARVFLLLHDDALLLGQGIHEAINTLTSGLGPQATWSLLDDNGEGP